MKHTKGPWEFTKDEGLPAGVLGVSALNGAVFICRIPAAMRDQAGADADGYLIAAAPDLLAACKAALSYIETPGDLNETEVGYLREDLEIAIARAKQLEAKGEGQ